MSIMSPAKNQSYQVLLVDDEEGDIELTRLALAESGFSCQVIVAKDGVEAMTALRRTGTDSAGRLIPDLVFLDLNMPRMSGLEVLGEMKKDPELSGIPVVVLSTSDVERDVAAAYKLGAAGYITKSVEMEILFQAIHAVENYWFDTVRRPRQGGGPPASPVASKK